MTVAIFSSTLNHYQLALSKEIITIVGLVNFRFVSCIPLTEERRRLGFDDLNLKYDFVIPSYRSDEDMENARDVMLTFDVVIFGVGTQEFLYQRIKNGLFTLKYEERLFKNGKWRIFNPFLYFKMLKRSYCYSKYGLMLLCASAFTADDYSYFFGFQNRSFKFGYFPEFIPDVNFDQTVLNTDLVDNGVINILWVGRFIKWKRPFQVVRLARYLKSKGVNFEINIIGDGVLEETIKNMVKNLELSSNVNVLSSMGTNQVRRYMQAADIFVFTSNRNEGWGVVLNEAMNSRCAVVAYNRIGSVPYLLKHRVNGLIYEGERDLFKYVEELCLNPDLINILQDNAYSTIRDHWNPAIAAKRLMSFSELYLKQGAIKEFETGILSKA